MLKRYIEQHPLSFRFALWVMLPLLLALLACVGYLKGSLPQTQGSLVIAGLNQPVEVVRDENGVANIFAKTDRDAFFAMGFVHAQDRLWQMDSQRRLAQGTMAEVLGQTALKSDQFMRTLGLYRAATQSVKYLSAAELDSLQAYADGVNHWLAQGQVLPPEYQLLQIKPEPWQVADSLVQFKLFALSLDGHYRKDLAYDLMVKTIGQDKANQVRQDYPKAASVVGQSNPQQAQYLDLLAQMLDTTENVLQHNLLGGEGVGSNAWVVSGKHTASGKPLLANDPHLKTQIPSAWYLAQLHGDKIHVVGATIPGAPLILTGHNRDIAWGVTALKADVQDIFLERTHPHEDNRYDVDGQWQAMEVREEQIRVRTEFPAYLNEPFEPVTWHVRSTRHGPLISDVLGKVDTPMALKWTALAEDDATYRGFYRLNYAHDWQSFNDALLDYNAPAMNFLYADVKGNIGYTVGGDIPVRADGDGRTPNMGWHSQGEWVGKIDKAALPKVFNPKSGYIVTANNKNHDADYPYYISNDWSPGYRATRISQLLDQAVAQGTRLKVEDMAQMQGDVKNLQAQQLIALFRQVQPQNSRQAKAIESLKQWDLEADMDSIGASIYHTWLRHFSKAILSDAFDTERLHIRRATEHRQITNSMFPLFLDRVVNGELSQWCDLPETDQVEDCVARAAKTLPATLDDLTLIGGSDIDDWQWGELHQTLYAHNVFNKIKLLDRLFDRTINSGGDGYTVNVAMTFFTKDDGYRQVTGATYRSVVDLANWQNSGFISDTGQSGNLLSPHYDDFIPVHNRLGLHPMSFGQSQARGDTLLLTPASTNQ